MLNCAALIPLVPVSARLVDVGSGAGLPGMVLAMARPDLSVTLVEPLLRRVTWLESAVEELELANVEVVRCRAENVPRSARDFDVATARAVAPLSRLVEWCLPLLRPGGVLLALKGESVAGEVIKAEPTLRKLGAREWSVETVGAELAVPPARVVRVLAGEGRRDEGRGR